MSTSAVKTPYIQLLHKKILDYTPDETNALIVQAIVILATKDLNETGELGKLSDEQIKEIDAKLQLIRHLLSSKKNIKSKYAYDIINERYSQDLINYMKEQKKKLISQQGTNIDKFFAEGLSGGKRKGTTKKSKKSRKSKKSKSRIRKHK